MSQPYTSPIIFSLPMVRSLLSQSKFQTRRLPTSQWANVKMHFDQGERCLLWVRESFSHQPAGSFSPLYYRASDEPTEAVRWKPSIHMSRGLSRLTLELSDVRLQRLQDLSESDAVAEGIERDPEGHGWMDYRPSDQYRYFSNPVDSYRSLWLTLHGADSWAENPEIVAMTFGVQERNVDEVAGSA